MNLKNSKYGIEYTRCEVAGPGDLCSASRCIKYDKGICSVFLSPFTCFCLCEMCSASQEADEDVSTER